MTEYRFAGGSGGEWRVIGMTCLCGAALPPAAKLDVTTPAPGATNEANPAWVLRGVVSNVRYATGREVSELRRRQAGLGRPEARHAALIPIRKTPAWWSLAQDERRAIFEETSRHTAIGMEYLPAVARRLHHSRDLGEPFDFLTWFEFAPEDSPAFDHMLTRLRTTAEWTYVDREIDIRLERVPVTQPPAP